MADGRWPKVVANDEHGVCNLAAGQQPLREIESYPVFSRHNRRDLLQYQEINYYREELPA
jgi:hypothetical protein